MLIRHRELITILASKYAPQKPTKPLPLDGIVPDSMISMLLVLVTIYKDVYNSIKMVKNNSDNNEPIASVFYGVLMGRLELVIFTKCT